MQEQKQEIIKVPHFSTEIEVYDSILHMIKKPYRIYHKHMVNNYRIEHDMLWQIIASFRQKLEDSAKQN